MEGLVEDMLSHFGQMKGAAAGLTPSFPLHAVGDDVDDIAFHGAQAAHRLGRMTDPLAPILAFSCLEEVAQPAVGIAGLFSLRTRALSPSLYALLPPPVANGLIQPYISFFT